MTVAEKGTGFRPVIDVRALTKYYGLQPALRNIDLRIDPGEVLVIFGPNGAGKSTLMRILATLAKPSSGAVTIGGLDLKDRANEVRRSIGVITHQPLLYDELTAYENLQFYGRMFKVPDLEGRIRTIISEVGLELRLFHRVRTFSRGMQQRLSLARALLHDPPILLLDEPETGLDQQAANLLKQKIGSYRARNRTVVVTTHRLEHGLELASRVVVLYKGRLAYQETRDRMDVDAFVENYCRLIGTNP